MCFRGPNVIAVVVSVAAGAAQLHGAAIQAARSTPPSSAAITFENITRTSGIGFMLRSGPPDKRYLIESTGGGVAIVDFDNDGWMDLYFVNGSTLDDERRGRPRAPNRLYRNNHDSTFADVTVRAGVEGAHWGMGVCTGDVNGDGLEDLYVTNVGPNFLYVNNGDGTFRDASEESGARVGTWSSSCAFADYDGDGNLDLYVSTYVRFDIRRPPERQPDGSRCLWENLEVACGPKGLTAEPDRFFENAGGGRFRDVTIASGVGRVVPSYGMGVVWGDYDNDGDQDVYVANDEMPNFLFRNNGDRTFTEVASQAGVALSLDGRPQGSMGVDFGDYDNDGNLDLIVTNFATDYNTLYRNHGNGAFSDATSESTMIVPTLPYVGWGVTFVDLDLDGFVDLPIANGHLYPQLADRNEPIASGRSYRQRNLLFRNLGNRRFGEVGERAGAGFRVRDALSSRGLAAGDLNNDGRMDLVITSLDDRPSVLLNRSTPGHWLMVRLIGTTSNRGAVGARVRVRTGQQVQIREVKSGGSYQSQSDTRLHFGLGTSSRIDELSILWPNGRLERRQNLAADRILVIAEGP